MKSLTTSGFICLEDDLGLVYKIARIDYTELSDGHFKYSFKPFYNVIDILPMTLFQGIPGLDLNLRREIYERENIVPTFISERTPGENREDVWQLLEENGMNSLNRLEWLIKTKRRYSGDSLFVIPCDRADVIIYREESMYDLIQRSDFLNKKILDIICFGDFLYTKEITVDDNTRLNYYRFLFPVYAKECKKRKVARAFGAENGKNNKSYKGKAEIKLDPLLLNKLQNDYINHKINAEEASKLLKISKSTFFRRLKKDKV